MTIHQLLIRTVPIVALWSFAECRADDSSGDASLSTLPATQKSDRPAPTVADVAYGEHPRQRLDFWRARSDQPTPVVIYLHGGAWSSGDKSGLSGKDFQKYLDAGVSYVGINYRYVRQSKEEGLKPPVQGPMHDAARAVQFVRSKAAEWNIDKTRIGVSGTSAGACTVLWIAFHADMADPRSDDPVARESTRVSAVAVKDAQTSLDPQQMKEWTPNSRYGQHAFGVKDGRDYAGREAAFADFLARRAELLPWIQEYSPYAHATADDPPVYMTYASKPAMGQRQKDPTHSANFGVKLQEQLRTLGVDSELVYPEAPGVKHADMAAFLIEKLKQ